MHVGKHSAHRRSSASRRRRVADGPAQIDRLQPATRSSETPRQHERRRRELTPSRREQRARTRKTVLRSCLIAAALLAFVAAAASFVFLEDVARRIRPADEMDPGITAALESEEPVKRGAPFYMVIMGVDKREGESVARSDTLIVARVDPPQESVTLLSIPRDTRVRIPGHGTQKINAAMALGGPALVIETVEEFTGLPITHYAEVDFNGFKEIVDALGGVTVNVPQKIQDPKAGNYDPEAYTIYAGEQRLTGAQALTFVRSREFPEGDLARIQNQQIFIKALLKQSLQFSNTLRLPSLVNAVADNITTDMSLTELLRLANDMKGMDDDALMTASMPGEPQYIDGVSYVIVDEEAFAALIDRMSQGLPPEPGPDEAPPAASPSEISVTVRNGAGIEGVASDAASRLTSAGFEVGEVGNANQFVYDETLIVYQDDEAGASAVKESLGFGKLVASRGMYAFDTDILVVVGKDWESLTGTR